MFLPTLVFGAVAAIAPAHSSHHVMRFQGDGIVCGGATLTEIHDFEVRGEKRRWERQAYLLDSYRERDITVEFDRDFPEDAKTAVRTAVNIWDDHLYIDVPIHIEASWYVPAEDEAWTNWAARAHISMVVENRRSIVVPALANQLMGRDVNGRDPEFEIEIKEDDDWYFGVDRNPPPDKLDLVSAVLHEITHGLGFVSTLSMNEAEEDEEPKAGYPLIRGARSRFDWFLWARGREGFLRPFSEDVQNPSREIYEAVTGIKLYWGGLGWTGFRGEPLRSAQAHGRSVLLAAPRNFTPPSHLDGDVHPFSVIEPVIIAGRAHRIDAVILGMLYDMGWELKERPIDVSDVLRCLEGR